MTHAQYKKRKRTLEFAQLARLYVVDDTYGYQGTSVLVELQHVTLRESCRPTYIHTQQYRQDGNEKRVRTTDKESNKQGQRGTHRLLGHLHLLLHRHRHRERGGERIDRKGQRRWRCYCRRRVRVRMLTVLYSSVYFIQPTRKLLQDRGARWVTINTLSVRGSFLHDGIVEKPRRFVCLLL